MFVSFNVLTVSSVNLYTVYASIIYCISCCTEYCTATSLALQPSVLWRCWLGSKKGIRPVKTEWWCADMVICLEQGADLHMAQLMPLPLTVSCFSKIQFGFTFLVPAHTGSLDKGPLNGCVWGEGVHGLLLWAHAWTDRQTLYHYTDPAPQTMQAVPTSLWDKWYR